MMEVLSTSLNSVTPPDSFSPVQDHWNSLELLLINATDSVAPLITVCQNTKTKTTALPNHVKNAKNKRKRLLKTDKVNSTTTNLPTIKLLKKEIKAFHLSKRISNVRRATTGQKGSIWNAVKQAKNLVLEEIPGDLTLGGVPVARGDVPNSFAKHFHDKVKNFVSACRVEKNVYNGKNKLIVANRNFTTRNDVNECINALTNKKCEGFDRIPVCVLKDCKPMLLDPFADLYSLMQILTANLKA